jgi:hypothetical protein
MPCYRTCSYQIRFICQKSSSSIPPSHITCQNSSLCSLSMNWFCWLVGLWCLTSLSTIFQLHIYRDVQFYWWRKPEYPEKTALVPVPKWRLNVWWMTTNRLRRKPEYAEKTTDLSQVTDKLYHIMYEYTLPWTRFKLTNNLWEEKLSMRQWFQEQLWMIFYVHLHQNSLLWLVFELSTIFIYFIAFSTEHMFVFLYISVQWKSSWKNFN